MVYTGTYTNAVAVTPSDTATIPPTAGLWVGGAGNLAVTLANDPTGTVVTFTAVPAGTLLPFRVNKVRATGTTATAIVALR